MSGGFPRPACRLSIPLLFVLVALPGCSLLYGPQQAPITEAEAVPVEPASAPPPAAPPAPPEPVQTEAARPEPPRKPKPPVFKPHKIEPPPPVVAPVAPPPAPAPLIVTRLIDRNQARALLDSEVRKPDGKVIGRAIDLIADASGKPREMVVNLQGFLGVGDRKVNFPWSAFRFAPAAKNAPITLNAGPRPASAAHAVAADAPHATASELALLDSTVQRSNGSTVGRVVDVLIDADAQPQAVVLDVSGMVSTERRTIAANWSALRIVTKNNALHPLLDLSDAQINAAPPYAADRPIRAISPAPPALPAPSAPPVAAASAPAPAAVPVSNARASR